MDFELPEPFRSAIERDEPDSVCDVEAADGPARYARGVARLRVGRDGDAREDFEAALEEIGDPCRVQLGLLDIRGGRDPADVADEARQIAERCDKDSLLHGRALHLLGMAEIKQRKSSEALDFLLRAAGVFRSLDRRDLLAQVQDSLGTAAAAEGRLDHAVGWYALSLVGKSLCGDRYGTAITLGNLGRLHLRAGRYAEAIDCLQLDLELAREMGDRRGEARLLNDLGRVHLEQQQLEDAEREISQSLEIAREFGFRDLEFFDRKDLALIRLAQGRPAAAEEELENARPFAAEGVPAFREALLSAVRGAVQLSSDDSGGLEYLDQAAVKFQELGLPDYEIPERIRIAEALCACGRPRAAEQQLTRAMELARRDGYARYLPAIREAMGGLSLVESAVEEEGRPIHAQKVVTSEAPEGYVLFESLGAGGFGEVFRAFDAEKARIVALKRLRLDQLYDVNLRQRLQATARLELEAASRIRHPGVARVHAVGTDGDGGTYIVQEFVDGSSLRDMMRQQSKLPLADRLQLIERIGDALHALHDEGVVHRDLKPENILLRSKDGSPVLVDFGIARVPDVEDVVGREHIVGTLGYMAPEQLRARAVDGKADVYSLGIVLLEWLTGEPPIRPEKKGISDAVSEVLNRRAEAFDRSAPTLPADIAHLIARMLAENPSARPSAEGVAQICGRLAGMEWSSVAETTPTSQADGESTTTVGDEEETEWLD
jgi:tRNA A-37 threonylcarbamoyl transferase component Bud32